MKSLAGAALTALLLGGAHDAWSAADARVPRDWPGFRGPSQTAAVEGYGLFDGVGAPSVEVAWAVTAGSGYAGVTVVDGRAFTAFSSGSDDVVAALDAASGRELWRRPLGARYAGHDGSHDGPIATPAADGRSVYALGPRGRLIAFDARTGSVRWSHDLDKDKDAVAPFYGWATSPLLAGPCAIVQHAIKGRQAIACFDRETGRVRWSAGKDEVSYQSPVLATLEGREQILAAGETRLYGLDPATGAVLWEYEHGGDGSPISTGSSVPLPIEGSRVLIQPQTESATLLHVKHEAAGWKVEPLWTSKGFRNTYSRPVYLRGHFYGYAGSLLVCVDAASGEVRWRSRAPGDGFLTLADGRLVVQTKTGSVHVAEVGPEAYRELAKAQVFDDHSWTAPSVAAGRLFVRGMTRVASLRIADASAASGRQAQDLPLGARFARLLEEVKAAGDKGAAVDAFLGSVASFPLIEDDVVEFLYRGPGRDLGIASELIGARAQRAMTHVEGTDLFYWTGRVRPRARLTYVFIRDFDETLPDPRNPRREKAATGELSWFAMPGWEPPKFLEAAPTERRGRLEARELASALVPDKRHVDVYLPPGYDAAGPPLPVVYVTGGKDAVELGALPDALDRLVGSSVPAMLVVFIHPPAPPAPGTTPPEDLDARASDSLAQEIVPFVDSSYRTRPERGSRAVYGVGWTGYDALRAAFRHPEVFGRVSTQSAFMITETLTELKALLAKPESPRVAVSLEWSSYDYRAEHEGWNMSTANRTLAELLETRGIPVTTREVNEGSSWGSWRNRADVVFGRMFE